MPIRNPAHKQGSSYRNSQQLVTGPIPQTLAQDIERMEMAEAKPLAPDAGTVANERAAKTLTRLGYKYQAGMWGYVGAEPERRKHLGTIINRLADLTKLHAHPIKGYDEREFIDRDPVMSAAQAIAAAAYALHAAPSPASAPAAEAEPVAWEVRHWNTNGPAWGVGAWSEWERVKPRNPHTDTVGDHLRDLRTYIARGLKYELRALYTRPASPAPAQGAGGEAEDLRDEIKRLIRLSSKTRSAVGLARHIQSLGALVDKAFILAAQPSQEAATSEKAERGAQGLTDEQIDELHDSMFPAPFLASDRVKIREFTRAALAATRC